MSGQLTLDDARAAGESAMNAAAEHAGDQWLEDAYRWLTDYLRQFPTYEPDSAWVHGCPLPPSGERRAFGAVVKRAIREGLMVKDGYGPRASGHGVPGPRYRSLLFRQIEGGQG